MPEFSYKARDLSGKSVLGQLTAADQQDAMLQLSAMQLFPIQIQAITKTSLPLIKFQQRIGSGQLVAFYSQLADLITSGVPLLRSLKLIEDQANTPALKQVVGDIRDQVADGKRLAQAMARHPHVFSNLVISLIEAGEEGSFLEDSLKRLAAVCSAPERPEIESGRSDDLSGLCRFVQHSDCRGDAGLFCSQVPEHF